MQAVREHADKGGLVLGICNGFQVLTEAKMLPGALRRNADLRFACVDLHLRVERNDLPFTRRYRQGQVISLPIAHGEGNYEHFAVELDRLEAARQVVFRYVSPTGEIDPAWNFNGSARSIAGVCNAAGNVLGLMPHPENHVIARQHPHPPSGGPQHLGLRLFHNGVAAAKEL
jgi:phosphoribosylformylglycinamidine synthase